MPLVSMTQLLDNLPAGKAIGSFTVGNMEMALGAVKAAEETGIPVILQIAEARLRQSPMHLFGPLLVEAAKQAAVEIGVHLDHGVSGQAIRSAIACGFSSVMFDGSHLPLRDNTDATKEMVTLAKSLNPAVSVEGELGVVGGSEDDLAARTARCTNPAEVAEYCAATGIDALAIAIGNAHGAYKAAPELRFDILAQIAAASPVPLVLHGGSGLTDDDFRQAIELGIKKVNIATAVFSGVGKHIYAVLNPDTFHDYRLLNESMIQGAYESVKKHILVFQGNAAKELQWI